MRDKETTPFIDYIKVYVRGGHGGAGCVSFRREKYVPRGGPDGGDGGKGGDVILQANKRLSTLIDLQHKPHLRAAKGANGMGNRSFGKDGDDVIAQVPVGTVVSDEEGKQLADLNEDGQQWVAAAGGRGGLGNSHFATPTNKTPRYAQEGEEGEERTLILELKLIADVGLVGLPNAGKSTLLSKFTAAMPKIAPYPFTTLSPNLGVIEREDLSHITLADIPGLIEGASKGVGLGDRFLRHIERTRLLCHLIGDEQGIFDPEDMIYKYGLVQQELMAYSSTLAAKPQIVVISKTDLADPDNLRDTVAAFRQRDIEPLCISAMSGEGLDKLRETIEARLDQLDPVGEEEATEENDRSDRVDY
ncbi:MAG: GTPase ObgE [Candidatus Sumerlaeia bacterium]